MKIHLVDLNPKVVAAWQNIDWRTGQIVTKQGNLVEEKTDVWVTSTNSYGHMNGGVDAAIKSAIRAFGFDVEAAVQNEINAQYKEGRMPIGRAVAVPVPLKYPRYLIATPTMIYENDDISKTRNTARACAAAFQSIYSVLDRSGVNSIASVAMPGLGAGTGQVSPVVCAKLMAIGYKLFIRKRYESFEEMEQHLEEEMTQALAGWEPELAPKKPFSSKVEIKPGDYLPPLVDVPPVEMESTNDITQPKSYLDAFSIGTVI